MTNMISNFFKGKPDTKGQPGGRIRTEPVTGLSTSQPLEAPYVAARREWNERYGSYVARARTWQMVALGSLGLSAVLGLSLVKVAGEAKVQPFVVEVDKLGQAVAVAPADTARMPDERIIRYQLAQYITDARSVTPDPIVQKRWLDEVYAVSSSATSQFLNDYYKAHDPFATAKNAMVSVEIQSALPLSKTSWQIEWTETRRGLDGQTQGITRWQAVVNLATYTPTTPQAIVANPTGLVINQINWTQQL